MACSCFSAIAQTAYEPSILILSPLKTSSDTALKSEIDQTNDSLKKMEAQLQANLASQPDIDKGQPENIKLMKQSSIRFAQHMDAFNQVAYYIQQYLTYRFFENFPNCLILINDEKSKDNLPDLQKLADEQHIAYILNFPKI